MIQFRELLVWIFSTRTRTFFFYDLPFLTIPIFAYIFFTDGLYRGATRRSSYLDGLETQIYTSPGLGGIVDIMPLFAAGQLFALQMTFFYFILRRIHENRKPKARKMQFLDFSLFYYRAAYVGLILGVIVTVLQYMYRPENLGIPYTQLDLLLSFLYTGILGIFIFYTTRLRVEVQNLE